MILQGAVKAKETGDQRVKLVKTKIPWQSIAKFYFHWLQLIAVHGIVFWYFPIAGNYKLSGKPYCPIVVDNQGDISDDQDFSDRCNDFGINVYQNLFYVLFILYFFFSSLQIKYGLTEMRGKGFLMNRARNFPNGWLIKGYFMIPFLIELKTITDWTFTKSSLGLFSWLRLANAHKIIFCAKCSNIKKLNRPLAKPSALQMKIG